MRSKLMELDDLINDVITVSETTLDWNIKQRLVKGLSYPIFGLLRELRLPRDYCSSDDASCQDDVLAFIGLLRETQKVIATVLDALCKKANDAMAGRQGFK